MKSLDVLGRFVFVVIGLVLVIELVAIAWRSAQDGEAAKATVLALIGIGIVSKLWYVCTGERRDE